MKIKKIFTYTLIGITLFSSIAPAYANTQYTDSTYSITDIDTPISKDDNSNCDVYAEIGSEFKVTIPKRIVLDGVTKSGTYQVTVEGDIAGLETINVLPDETIALSSKDKPIVTGVITQDKTIWSYNEILKDSKVIGNGLIKAEDISAGAWNGTFNFNIGLTQKPGVYDSQGQLLMNWEDLEMNITKDYDYNSLIDDTTSSANVFLNIKASEVKVVIPYGTTKIGAYAFFDCDKLVEIEIPNTITEIGDAAFSSSGLREIVVPDSVTKINDFTFDMCSDLTTVTLGNNTKSIGKQAFNYCTNLEKITMPEDVEIGVLAFNGCTKLN